MIISAINIKETLLSLGIKAVSDGSSEAFINHLGIASESDLLTTTSSISGNLQNQITSEVNLRTSQTASLSANKLDKTGGVISSDLTIQGNLTVNGTQFIVNTQAVSARDNLIVINAGEVGAGVTSISAGIIVDRGSLQDYAFLFDETTDRFKIGTIDNMQPVATREETPLNNSLAIWDSSSSRFKTDSNLGFSGGILNVAGNTATTPAANQTNIGGGQLKTAEYNLLNTLPYYGLNTQNGSYMSFAIGGSDGPGVTDWANSPIIEAVPPTSGGGFVLSAYRGPLIFQTNNRTTSSRINQDGSFTITGTAPSTPTAGTTEIGGGIISTAGDIQTGSSKIVGNNTNISLSTINVWVATGLGAISGIISVRDHTNGTQGLYAVDSVPSTTTILAQTDIQVQHTGSDVEIRFTGGTSRSVRIISLVNAQ